MDVRLKDYILIFDVSVNKCKRKSHNM